MRKYKAAFLRRGYSIGIQVSDRELKQNKGYTN